MLRLIGAAMLIAGTAGIGFSMKADMQERVKQLKYMVHMMELMKSEIGYYQETLPVICAHMGAKANKPYDVFFHRVYERMGRNDGTNFTVAWQEESARLLSGMPLSKAEKMIWTRFCEYTGYGDGRMQETAVLSQITELTDRIRALEAESAVKGKLYTSLGAAGGILLAIILI